MSDQVIEVFNAEIVRLEEELAPHSEARCECHDAKECVCYENDIPYPGTLAVIGVHCTREFVLDCELSDLKFPYPKS